MVALGISEFTFGFAFLFEQTRNIWGNLRIAPILPNLWEENELGWDAHLPLNGTSFYYQFKLSELLIRPYAKYRREPPYYQGEYFRVRLHKHDQNRQHRLLRELSTENSHTYYVAPETISIDIFNQAFLSGSIVEHSRLIPLEDCDDINDGEQHYITYQEGNPAWYLHSKPSPHGRSISGKHLEEFYKETAETWRPIDDEYANLLFQRVSDKVGEITPIPREQLERPEEDLLDFNPQDHTRAETIDQAAKILFVFFGISLVIAGEPG